MFKIQMHFHTAESSACARVPAETGIGIFQKAGYDGVIITDHFSASALGRPGKKEWGEIVERFLLGYQKAKAAGEKLGIAVYLGMEIRFPHDDNDFLVYGFDPEFLYGHPWIYMGELDTFRETADEYGLFVAQAHPFRVMCTPARPELLDGVEIHNGNCRHNSRNDLAKAWAQEHDLIGIIGADFHKPDDLCCNPVWLDQKPEDETSLARALRHRAFRIGS